MLKLENQQRAHSDAELTAERVRSLFSYDADNLGSHPSEEHALVVRIAVEQLLADVLTEFNQPERVADV